MRRNIYILDVDEIYQSLAEQNAQKNVCYPWLPLNCPTNPRPKPVGGFNVQPQNWEDSNWETHVLKNAVEPTTKIPQPTQPRPTNLHFTTKDLQTRKTWGLMHHLVQTALGLGCYSHWRTELRAVLRAGNGQLWRWKGSQWLCKWRQRLSSALEIWSWT